jgi:hypothetical protein
LLGLYVGSCVAACCVGRFLRDEERGVQSKAIYAKHKFGWKMSRKLCRYRETLLERKRIVKRALNSFIISFEREEGADFDSVDLFSG